MEPTSQPTFPRVLALGLGLALCVLFSQRALAQDDLAQLTANRDKKLASPFLKAASWGTDFEAAQRAARTSQTLILAYFTRSYAPCGPCLQLEQTVLAKPEFAALSKDVVLFFHVTTKIPTDSHPLLFAEKGGSGFPTMMVLDESGNVLARQCGCKGVQGVRDLLAEGQGFAARIRQAASCDAETRFQCLVKQIEYGHFTPDEARSRASELTGLSEERRKWLDATITSRECALAFLAIRREPDDAGRMRAAKRLVDMKKAGHVPSDANTALFWEWVMSYAADTQDVCLYEEGIGATKALLPDGAEARERVQQLESKLEGMKRDARRSGAAIVQPRESSTL